MSLLRWLDSRALAPADWLRRGWPRAPLFVLIVAAPAALAGPIRAATGVGLELALGLAAVATVLLALPFWRALTVRAQLSAQVVAANVVVVAAAVAAVWLLFAARFHGLPNSRSDTGLAIDAAFHMSYYHRFLQREPAVYAGFVSMYSTWWTLVHVARMSLPQAARVTCMTALAVTAVGPCVVAFSVLHARRDERASFAVGTAACVVAAFVTQLFVVLPMESFHLTAGFWAPLQGLIVLVAIWWADALVRPRLLRVLCVLALAALYRYTYGLNLLDLFVTLAVLLLLEAASAGVPAIVRVVLVLGGLACLYALRNTFAELRPLLPKLGWIITNDLVRVMRAQVIGAVALALWIAGLPSREAVAGTGVRRALRFPMLLALANVVWTEVIRSRPGASYYYPNKYSFHAVVLLACALVVLVTAALAACAYRRRARTLIAAAICVALAGVAERELHEAFAGYQPAFQEHAFGRPPYRVLNAWHDAGAYDRIRRTLATERRAFGGYLAGYWPRLVFENAVFGFGNGDFWIHPTVERSAGHCVFWDPGQSPALDSDPQKSCERYIEPWTARGEKRTLCWRCD